MADTFINATALVAKIRQFKAANPTKKVAFCFSGGGARGAYFGGVLEAIQREVNKTELPNTAPEDRWKPDMICASSAGALAGFAYWLDCLKPSNPAPYACRQSALWRQISDGNRGAEKLFSNFALVDFMSNSSLELDAFLDAVDKLQQDINVIRSDLSDIWDDIKDVISNTTNFNSNRLQNDIQARISELQGDVSNVSDAPNSIVDIPDYISDLLALINHAASFLPGVLSDFVNMGIDQAKELIISIETLWQDIVTGAKDIGQGFSDLQVVLNTFQTLFSDLVQTIKATLKSIKDNSSLMNTEGLQRVLEQYIVSSFGLTSVSGSIDARGLDTEVFNVINSQKALGKPVPDLFITATDINAKRSVVFSTADITTNNMVEASNLWVVGLEESGIDYSSHKIAPRGKYVFDGKRFGDALSNPVSVPKASFNPNFIGGEAKITHVPRGLPITTGHAGGTVETVDLGSTALAQAAQEANLSKAFSQIGIQNTLSDMKVKSPGAGIALLQALADPEFDYSHGASLLVGSILTSASIPVVFPPRKWTFFSSETPPKRFIHWMVDGGIVDNRPIDVAVKAGADFIVSFELTPLLSATTEMRAEVDEYPKLGAILKKSMYDSTLNAGFYRYFEDLVSENANVQLPATEPKLAIYRFAPMMYADAKDVDYGSGPNWNDQTPDALDFNGKYDSSRNVVMGLFDWFMKGFIDARGGDYIDPLDPVNAAYLNLPHTYGAKFNAFSGRRSGFYDASIVPHPTTSPPW